MPTTVSKEIKVRELRQNDRLADNGATVVHPIKTAVKYASFELSDGRRPRLPLDDTITVLRDEPTDDERRAERLSFAADQLRDHLRKTLRNDPRDVTARILAQGADNEFHQTFTSFNLTELLEAQALYAHAVQIRNRVQVHSDFLVRTPEDVRQVTDEAIFDAYADWWYSNVTRREGDYAANPLSRSTSVLANVIEDVERWALRRVPYDVRWTGGYDEVLRRAELLKRRYDDEQS